MAMITGTIEARINLGWRFWVLQKSVYIWAILPESWHDAAINWAGRGVKIDAVFVDA